jgi:hypothetical protein
MPDHNARNTNFLMDFAKEFLVQEGAGWHKITLLF